MSSIHGDNNVKLHISKRDIQIISAALGHVLSAPGTVADSWEGPGGPAPLISRPN